MSEAASATAAAVPKPVAATEVPEEKDVPAEQKKAQISGDHEEADPPADLGTQDVDAVSSIHVEIHSLSFLIGPTINPFATIPPFLCSGFIAGTGRDEATSCTNGGGICGCKGREQYSNRANPCDEPVRPAHCRCAWGAVEFCRCDGTNANTAYPGDDYRRRRPIYLRRKCKCDPVSIAAAPFLMGVAEHLSSEPASFHTHRHILSLFLYDVMALLCVGGLRGDR